MIRQEDIVGYSLYGTPYASDIEFQAGKYINSEGQTIEYQGILLYDMIMVVNQTKNIVKTPVQGRAGSFKEYISDGDFNVTITGKLSPPDKESVYIYPEDAMNTLIELCKVQDSIAVVCKYLQRFSIYNLVIESYDLPQTEGSHTIQAFTLNCLSDEPVELILK